MIVIRHSVECLIASLRLRITMKHLSRIRRAVAVKSLVLILGVVSSVAAQDEERTATSSRAALPKEQRASVGVDKPAVRLHGKVLAADNSLAAGATVWAAKVGYGPLERRETITDAHGHYNLDLDPGTWYVWARRGTQGGEGADPHEAAVKIARGRLPETVDIRLEERGKLHGRLLEAETGKPITGGKLFLDAGLILTTGADGQYEVGGVSREGHEGFVVAPGRVRMRVLFDTTVRAANELDVPVPRGGKIVGRVTDLGGKPIPGAFVGRATSGRFFSGNGGLFVTCDAEGRFEYDGVTLDQPTWLSATAPGHAEEQYDGLIVPPGGKPLELHFQLRPKPVDAKPGASPVPRSDDETQRTLSGIVRGPDNKPVAGVRVRWGYQPVADSIQTRTNAEGRFRLSVPNIENMLAVLPRDFTPEFMRIVAGGDRAVEFKLREGHTVRGWVLDEGGKPIKNVDVIAVIASPDVQIGNPYWLSEAAVRTDADGKFALKGIPDGARFDFLKQGMSEIRNHELTLGGADNTVTVTLHYGGAIKGRVVDRDGKPIRSFRLLVNAPREQRPGDASGGYFAGYCGIGVRFTSDDGSFVLTGVGAGSVHRIMAIAEGRGQAVIDRVMAVPLNHLTEIKPVTLRAGPPVVLRVRAVTADSKPIPGARVTLVNGDVGLDRTFSWGYNDATWEDMVHARTGAGGWAEFPALSFAEATLLVQAPGYGRHRYGWREGQKELTVKLAAEAVLGGEVHDATGGPMKAYYLNLISGGDQISATVGPEAKGRFRVGELPAGLWTISVRSADSQSTLHEENVILQAGETKQLKIATKKN
jgi:Protein of unknown function (DUF1416)